MLIRGIASGVKRDQDDALARVRHSRWADLPQAARDSTVASSSADRRPVLNAILAELVIAIIDKARVEGTADPVRLLASGISDEVAEQVERRLSGKAHRRRGNHLWCVVLAAFCRVYDEASAHVKKSADRLTEALLDAVKEAVSKERGKHVRPRDVYSRKTGVAEAFAASDYPWLREVIGTAVGRMVDAGTVLGEDAVMKYVRLIGVIVCPDLDRHPAVVKHCLWPLVEGPFKVALDENLGAEMGSWLRNAYRFKP